MIPIINSIPPIKSFNAQPCKGAIPFNLHEYLKMSGLIFFVPRRNLSESFTYSFCDGLKKGKEALLRFSKLTPVEQAELLTRIAVSKHLGYKNVASKSQIEKSWNILAASSSSNFPSLASYDSNSPWENFLEIFTRHSRPLAYHLSLY